MRKPRTLLYWAVATATMLAVVAVGEAERPHARGWITVVQALPSEYSGPQHPEPTLSAPKYQSVRQWLPQWVLDPEALKLYVKWVVGAPALVVFIILVMLLRPRRRPAPPALVDAPRPTLARQAVHRPRSVTKAKPAKATAKLSGQQQILRFFLQLFQRQQGAEPDALAQIYLVAKRPICPNETHEMRVLHNDEWITRRMSVGLLGQGGGSRSKCFYVIYDTHMVVKIPAVRITRFSDYKRQIAAEGRIVARLAPLQCIVPRVSVILKALHTFPDSDHLTEKALEVRYMRLLADKPELQEHLKIEGSFALFMDLAKHYFLSTILEEIHSGYGRLSDEAREHPELLWDPEGFVCRYGEEAAAVCHALQEVYYRYKGRLCRLAAESGNSKEVPVYHLKQWFLTHMVGETIAAKDYGMPAGVIEKVNQLLLGVTREHRRQVERYRRYLNDYIRETRFSRYRRQVESLAANILELLAWIGQKNVAMRDLKPENLFVAGNPDEYPLFLNDPKKFTIGLIDVETAVAIDAHDPVLIAQPQLAGTPLYATPTHLMPNAVLLEVYEDLGLILHLQDWHATIAILFKLITGEHLFISTAHIFPEILSRLKRLDPAGPSLLNDIVRIQQLFWNSAVAEFEAAMALHARTIAQVDVAVPEALVAEVSIRLRSDIDEIKRAVASAAKDQSFFNSGEKRRYLKEASAEKIGQMRSRLAHDQDLPKDPILLYFELFERLKTRLEHKQRALSTISAPGATVGADHLLEAMFQRVRTIIYPTHWPALSPAIYGRRVSLDPDITTYQATM